MTKLNLTLQNGFRVSRHIVVVASAVWSADNVMKGLSIYGMQLLISFGLRLNWRICSKNPWHGYLDILQICSQSKEHFSLLKTDKKGSSQKYILIMSLCLDSAKAFGLTCFSGALKCNASHIFQPNGDIVSQILYCFFTSPLRVCWLIWQLTPNQNDFG